MQFRNFIWPNEPSSLRVTSRRRTALLEEPGGGWTLQDLGTAARTVAGEGVFFGDSAKAKQSLNQAFIVCAGIPEEAVKVQLQNMIREKLNDL